MKTFLRPQASLRPYATLEGENSASGWPRSLTDLSPAVEAPTMSACSHTRCSYPCFSRSSSSLAFFKRWRFSHLQEKHKGIHKTISLTWQELPVLKKQQSNHVSTGGGKSNFQLGVEKPKLFQRSVSHHKPSEWLRRWRELSKPITKWRSNPRLPSTLNKKIVLILLLHVVYVLPPFLHCSRMPVIRVYQLIC